MNSSSSAHRPMIVMQLLSSLKHDDAERGIYHIAHTLVKDGHKSIIVAGAPDDDDFVARLTKDGSHYHHLDMTKKSWWSLRQILPLTRLIEHYKPNVIHVHSRTPAWVLHWTLKLLKKKQQLHTKISYTFKHKQAYEYANYEPKIISSMYGFYPLNSYSKALFFADIMIVASQSIEKYINEAISDMDDGEIQILPKIVRVRRGVDVRIYPYRHHSSVHWLQHIFTEFPELEHKKWLVFPTRIGEEYGQEWLIDIIGNLKNKFPNIHVIVMDNDSNEGLKHAESVVYDDFRQRLMALNLNEYVSFVGQKPVDLKDWLSSANMVLALANQPESIGMTALQAIHLGTPVIGWDKGAFGDILTNLYPRGLVTTNSAHAVCKAISCQLETGVRPVITNEYEIDTMVDETLQVYQNALSNAMTPSSQP